MMDGIGAILGSVQSSTNLYSWAVQKYDIRNPPPPADMRVVAEAAAMSCAEQGDRIIDRLAFWQPMLSLPILRFAASPIASRLVDKLERETDEIERRLLPPA